MTYRQYDQRGDQYARWAMAHGVAKGDVVALMMPNRPEYLAVWLGIARAGGVIALLNTNLTGTALAHCVNIVKAKHVIVDAALVDGFRTARAASDGRPSPLVPRRGAGRLRAARHAGRRACRTTPIPDGELPRLTIEDKCLFVYTSGTTGLPKAANINHYRVQSIMFGFNGAMRMRAERPHLCLPADVSHVRRRARPGRGADGRRERRAPREILRRRCSGTTSSSTNARSSSISASSAATS